MRAVLGIAVVGTIFSGSLASAANHSSMHFRCDVEQALASDPSPDFDHGPAYLVSPKLKSVAIDGEKLNSMETGVIKSLERLFDGSNELSFSITMSDGIIKELGTTRKHQPIIKSMHPDARPIFLTPRKHVNLNTPIYIGYYSAQFGNFVSFLLISAPFGTGARTFEYHDEGRNLFGHCY